MRTTRRGRSAIIGLIGLLTIPLTGGAAVAAGPAHLRHAAFPVTVTTAAGKVTIGHRPLRIVSLSPTATEMLYSIGAGAQVRAVDSFSDYPPQAPITKLSGYTPNVEAIATYKPDLVVVSSDSSGFAKQMANLKVPVIYDPAATNLAQAYQQFVALGSATGNVTGAQREVANLRTKIAQIVHNTPRTSKGTTYYYELDPTYYSVTSSTFVGQLFALLGLKSIADSAKGVAASGGYPQLSAEFILRANPSYVFLADTVCCRASFTTVATRPGWSSLNAVKSHRVIGLNDDIASRWGPRITVLLQDVANALVHHS